MFLIIFYNYKDKKVTFFSSIFGTSNFTNLKKKQQFKETGKNNKFRTEIILLEEKEEQIIFSKTKKF